MLCSYDQLNGFKTRILSMGSFLWSMHTMLLSDLPPLMSISILLKARKSKLSKLEIASVLSWNGSYNKCGGLYTITSINVSGSFSKLARFTVIMTTVTFSIKNGYTVRKDFITCYTFLLTDSWLIFIWLLEPVRFIVLYYF